MLPLHRVADVTTPPNWPPSLVHSRHPQCSPHLFTTPFLVPDRRVPHQVCAQWGGFFLVYKLRLILYRMDVGADGTTGEYCAEEVGAGRA